MDGMGFDKNGNLVLPKFEIEQRQREKELMKSCDKHLQLSFLGVDFENFITCTWRLELPKGIIGKEIIKLKGWANRTVNLKARGRAWIERENTKGLPPKYLLMISGQGYDERCTWCRSFRTALKTRMLELKCMVQQKGSCKFESD